MRITSENIKAFGSVAAGITVAFGASALGAMTLDTTNSVVTAACATVASVAATGAIMVAGIHVGVVRYNSPNSSYLGGAFGVVASTALAATVFDLDIDLNITEPFKNPKTQHELQCSRAPTETGNNILTLQSNVS
jgi:hypothetical protein